MGVVSINTKTSDKIVREKLIETLLVQHDTLGVMQELEVARGRVRADVVRLSDGSVHAYEIKSDLDTLRRLPRQIRHYSEVFSTVTLVVGIDHVVEALYLIPEWWGVVVAEVDGIEVRLSPIRQVQQNSHTNYEAIFDLLRRHELVKILGDSSSAGSWHSMPKQRLAREIQQGTNKELLVAKLVNTLLSRDERLALKLHTTL